MAEINDFYEILGVKDVSLDEITNAQNKILHAGEVLSDPVKRKSYDESFVVHGKSLLLHDDDDA